MNSKILATCIVTGSILVTGLLSKSRATDGNGAPANPPGIGDAVPDVGVTGSNGSTTRLRDIVSKKPTVLIFYRGGWCPYCNTHLGKLQSNEAKVGAAGYQIVAISPDRPAELRKSLEKHDLTYHLFFDSTMAAAKAFGLAFTVENATVVKYRIVGINLEKASGEKHPHAAGTQ